MPYCWILIAFFIFLGRFCWIRISPYNSFAFSSSNTGFPKCSVTSYSFLPRFLARIFTRWVSPYQIQLLYPCFGIITLPTVPATQAPVTGAAEAFPGYSYNIGAVFLHLQSLLLSKALKWNPTQLLHGCFLFRLYSSEMDLAGNACFYLLLS